MQAVDRDGVVQTLRRELAALGDTCAEWQQRARNADAGAAQLRTELRAAQDRTSVSEHGLAVPFLVCAVADC
jgi:hypothetical protein